MSGPAPLSPTSAAVLGQLAWREQTTYELVKAMGVNMRFFWPRAESHVYREVKRLVELGLAIGEPGMTGRRPRTIYRITPQGRAALAVWMATPAGGFAAEHEPLLRVFLGIHGDREQLLAAIATARAQAEEMLSIAHDLAEEYLADRHPYQEQVHLRALTFDYLSSWALLTREWADRSEREVRRWSHTGPTPAKHRRAKRHLRALVGRLGARAA